MIEVKCPKCRYRFQAESSAGENQIACVCPRCGTPFVYDIPEEQRTGMRLQEDVHATETKTVATTSATNETQTQHADVKPRPIPSAKTTKQKPSSAKRATRQPSTNYRPTAKQHNGCLLKGCLLIFAFCGMILFFIVSGWWSNRYHSDENSIFSDVENQTEAQATTSQTDETNPKPLPAPDWIQGVWTVNTNYYGTITLRIEGNHIEETTKGGISKGSFYYSKGQLNCDFGDKRTLVYRLDETQHRIDAGEGLLMRKVKF